MLLSNKLGIPMIIWFYKIKQNKIGILGKKMQEESAVQKEKEKANT